MGAFIQDNGSFTMFSGEHLVAAATVLLLAVVLPVLTRNRLSRRHQRYVARGMALFISGVLVAWTGMAIWVGHYDWTEDLPIHVCYGLSMVLPIFAWKPWPRAHEVIYYWVLAGTLQAILTPRLFESFPHYDFIYYWVTHGGLVIYAVYVTATQRLFPTRRGILRAWVWLNVLAAGAFAFNSLAGTNYLYLMEKPETVSLLDLFGPWPWYILVTEAVALCLFVLCYAPFSFARRSY